MSSWSTASFKLPNGVSGPFTAESKHLCCRCRRPVVCTSTMTALSSRASTASFAFANKSPAHVLAVTQPPSPDVQSAPLCAGEPKRVCCWLSNEPSSASGLISVLHSDFSVVPLWQMKSGQPARHASRRSGAQPNAQLWIPESKILFKMWNMW